MGSFLRPERLKEARGRAGMVLDSTADAQGSDAISMQELHEIESECIRELVKLEEDVGLASITDGEFRRGSWAYDTTARIEGIVLKHQEGVSAQIIIGIINARDIRSDSGARGQRIGQVKQTQRDVQPIGQYFQVTVMHLPQSENRDQVLRQSILKVLDERQR